MTRSLYALLAGLLIGPASVPAAPLIVVEDRGGVSAAPYYQRISPEPDDPEPSSPLTPLEAAQGLPLRSPRLSPGPVSSQAIQAPGLQLVPTAGDDLAERLGLTHYPVLVTSSALEQ